MEAAIFEALAVLGDATRSRMLLLLERHELTVGEACAVLQLPQSTVSRHLKVLADAGWVTSRRDGTSRFYRAVDSPVPATRRLWALLREEVSSTPAAGQDARRAKTMLARRQSVSQRFFESAAGRWDTVRAELFGRAFHLHAIAGLLDHRWTIGDLGCGTGQLASALAPFVARVVAVDRSAEMLSAARTRLRESPAVELRRGDLEALPIADAELDAAIVMLVLHHLPDPAAVLRDTARALRAGGRLLVLDMLPHDREEYRQQMGHVWLGFAEDQMHRLLGGSGFGAVRMVPLPVDAEAKGPALFAAAASRA